MTKVDRNIVISAIYKAVRNLGLINKKWLMEYIDYCDWIAMSSTKSGMCVTFPVLITITDNAVELRTDKDEFAFFRHLAEEGDWFSDNEEITEVLASVLEDELSSFISRYWAKK